MNWSNPRSVEAKITRLTREIEEIDQFFYGGNENEDRDIYAGMLERKRDDTVRSAVSQMHMAIEDLLNTQIICHILNVKSENRKSKMRTKSGKALRRMLFGGGSMGFDMKLNFTVALGLLDAKTKKSLEVLNTLRNRCSHNWLLKVPVRNKRRPKQKKPPLLLYKGRDLHNVVMLKEFTKEYGSLYYRLFVKVLG